MTYQPAAISDDLSTVPQLPGWVTSGRAETPEDVAFLSGAALSHLHLVLTRDEVPKSLVRERLALRAAEACVTHQGRPERAGDLRDAVAFLQPGDQPGPAGAVCLSWQRAVERPHSVTSLHRALPGIEAAQVAKWLDGYDPRGAGQGAPLHRAARVLETVLDGAPRAEVPALILADATLAQALGWDHVVPLLAAGLKRAELRQRGEDLRLACHRAVVAAAVEAAREAAALARRVTRLREVVPRLRAKGAEAAVALFLIRDAVAPGDLVSLRSDRAARRFCDRLVALGAVRELTGRDTFRLYGV